MGCNSSSLSCSSETELEELLYLFAIIGRSTRNLYKFTKSQLMWNMCFKGISGLWLLIHRAKKLSYLVVHNCLINMKKLNLKEHSTISSL